MKLFIANISRECPEEELKEAFLECGEIKSLKIIKDKETGQSRGFGFVEMSNREGGKKAIVELNGKQLHGRSIVVTEAKEQERGGRSHAHRGGRRQSYLERH